MSEIIKKVSFDAKFDAVTRLASKLALVGKKPSEGLRALVDLFNNDEVLQMRVIKLLNSNARSSSVEKREPEKSGKSK